MVLSPAIYSELVEVHYRPRLRRYVSDDERRLFLRSLDQIAKFIDPVEPIHACRDPKDDKFLETAVVSKAVAIITRDRDLLVLDLFRGIRIFEAQKFVESLGAV